MVIICASVGRLNAVSVPSGTSQVQLGRAPDTPGVEADQVEAGGDRVLPARGGQVQARAAGPPGLNSSTPSRLAWFVALIRLTATLSVPASGGGRVQRHAHRGALCALPEVRT